MEVKIKRSPEYVKQQTITAGHNVPSEIAVEIDPAALTETTRRAIVGWCDQYPAKLQYLRTPDAAPWDCDTYNGGHVVQADVEPQDYTPAMLDQHIAGLIVQAEAAQQKYDQAQAKKAAEKAAEEAERTAQGALIDRFLTDPISRGTDIERYGYKHITIYGVRVTGNHPRWSELDAEQTKREKIDQTMERAARMASQLAEYMTDPDARPGTTREKTAWDRIGVPHCSWYFHPGDPGWDELLAETQRRLAIDAQTRTDWIAANGSDRLRRLVAEDIEHEAVYQEERGNERIRQLAKAHPGWAFERHIEGEAKKARNSRQEGLDLLDEARKTAPDAKLVWWIITEEEDREDEDTGEMETVDVTKWKGYACTAEFLGKDIVYGVPSEYAC